MNKQQTIYTGINGQVQAIKKWKDEFIIIVVDESGGTLLAVEDKVPVQVKPRDRVSGDLIDGILHIHEIQML